MYFLYLHTVKIGVNSDSPKKILGIIIRPNKGKFSYPKNNFPAELLKLCDGKAIAHK